MVRSKTKTVQRIPSVVVVGAGRMGADIALAFALSGWNVNVVETDDTVRKDVLRYWTAELNRLDANTARYYLQLHSELGAVAWRKTRLVVEAVPEDLKLKRHLLREIEVLARRDTIITTNTSSLRVRDVMRGFKRPELAAGLHFMVPAHVMLAVEITRAPKTSDATANKLLRWMKSLGKVSVVLNRDIPGMLINRIQHAMYREIYYLIDKGIVTPRDVDLAVRFGFGFRYMFLGPVISRDIHGLAVHLATARRLYPTLHNGTNVPRCLQYLVTQGHLGVRSGTGFYRWDPNTTQKRLVKFTELLETALASIVKRGDPAEF